MLTAFYDLAVSPPTWEFARFLVRALCERGVEERPVPLEPGRGILLTEPEPVRVVVVPGPRDGFRDDTLPPDLPMRRQMLAKIVLRYGELHAGVVTEFLTREQAVEAWEQAGGRVWPPGYHPTRRPLAYYAGPRVHEELAAHWRQTGSLPALRIPGYAATWAREMVGGRRAVLLVLRECAYWPTRNSLPDEWLAFGRWLRDARGVTPLVVRDAARDGEPFGDLETIPGPGTDLVALAALTQAVECSFWVNNGTAALVWYGNPAPWRIFKPVAPGAPCVEPAFHRACQVGEDGRFPWGTDDQRYVWADDTFEALRGEWEARDGV